MPLPLSRLSPDENGMVKIVSGKSCTTKFSSTITYEKAIAYVREGGGCVKSKNTIIKYYCKKRTKQIIFKRDKGICHYCGNPANTLDHKKPRSKGGYSTPANLVCCCYSCNQMKGNMDYDKFIRLIGNKSIINIKVM